MTQTKAKDIDFILSKLSVVSPYGDGAKQGMRPYQSGDENRLEKDYCLQEDLLGSVNQYPDVVTQIRHLMKQVKPLGHTFERLEIGETLSVMELFEIKGFQLLIHQLIPLFEKIRCPETYQLVKSDAITNLLDPEKSGNSAFHLYSAYSEKLTKIRHQLLLLAQDKKKHEQAVIADIGEKGLKVKANGDIMIPRHQPALIGFASHHPHLKYLSEVSMYHVYQIRYSADLIEREDHLKAMEMDEELVIREMLSGKLRQFNALFIKNCQHLGAFDLLLSKVLFAKAFHCIRPQVDPTQALAFRGGIHLKVSQTLKAGFTPIDFSIDAPVTLITGANMGGKTVSLKLIGLLQEMVQYGLFVPCQTMTTHLYDFIFVSVGDGQSIDEGLSTFGAEIVALSQVINNQKQKGLILIDEIARGTNPREGHALSQAIIETLMTMSHETVMTTHYDGLNQIEGISHYEVNGLQDVDFEAIACDIKEKGIALLRSLMDYRLTKVSDNKAIPKDAISIAEMMGLNPEIVNQAKKILGGSGRE